MVQLRLVELDLAALVRGARAGVVERDAQAEPEGIRVEVAGEHATATTARAVGVAWRARQPGRGEQALALEDLGAEHRALRRRVDFPDIDARDESHLPDLRGTRQPVHAIPAHH